VVNGRVQLKRVGIRLTHGLGGGGGGGENFGVVWARGLEKGNRGGGGKLSA